MWHSSFPGKGTLTLLLSTQGSFPNKVSCFVSTCVSSDNSFPSVRQPYCSPPGCPFPIKSLALSAHVSPQTIHFWLLDKSPISGPGSGPFSCNRRTDAEAKAPILRPPDVKRQLIEKDSGAGKDWRQKEKQAAEDEIVGWHHWLNKHESEQTLGDSEGQRSLACCIPWCHKELDTT